MDSTDRVIWLAPPRPTGESCFLCSNQSDNEVFMSALHPDARRGHMDVARCGSCASAWFLDFDAFEVQYPDDNRVADQPDFRLLVHHYLELVSGLHWKVALSEQLPFDDVNSVLEVGCNVGAFLDYVHRVWGADVEGLEPSAYGTAGRDMLDLPISSAYMSDARHLDGRTFDLVYATEVLEHVPDPQSFLDELRSFTRPGGIAFITTPRAASLVPSTPRGELYAALSTGGHRFLASPHQLTDMIRAAGFAWSAIEPFGMTQFAVMADHPIELGPLADPQPRLVEYYEHRVTTAASTNPRMEVGDLLHRYVTGRRIDEPGDNDLEVQIEQRLSSEFDIDIRHLGPVIERQRSSLQFAAFGRDMPYHLPEYLFWRGQRDDVSEAERTDLWEAAAMISGRGMRADPVNLFTYLESLTLAVDALAGRRPGKWSAELARLLREIPEASDLQLEPATVSTMRRLGESAGAVSAVRRLRAMLRSLYAERR